MNRRLAIASISTCLSLLISGCSLQPTPTPTPVSSLRADTPTPSARPSASPTAPASGPYSNADLEAFIALVEGQRAWFDSIHVVLVEPGLDALTHTVRVRYIAKDDSAGPAILAHFGYPSWLTPKWYGPPPWTGPRGGLVISFVDPAGRPLAVTAGITCSPVAVDTSVGYESLPRDTQGTSRCVFDDVPAVAWEVGVRYTDRHDTNKTLHRKVTVPADGTGAITVEIRR